MAAFQIALVATVCLASATTVVTEPTTVLDWTVGARAHPETLTTFTIKMRAQNLARVFEIAQDVSNPLSKTYGQYLSADEVNNIMAPKSSDVAVVTKWLLTGNVAFEVQAHLGLIVVTDKVATLESLLATTFHELTDAAGRMRVRARAYTIPATVAPAVAAVFGLHGLPLPARVPAAASVGAVPIIGPLDLIKAYGIAGVTPSSSHNNRQAVAEFQGQLMAPADLKAFFKNYYPSAPANFSKVFAYHGNPGSGEGIEAQLDIQYIMGVAPGILTEFYEQMNNDFCSDLVAWTALLLNTSDVPLVHSISYGWQGPLSQLSCTDAEVAAVDTNFAALATRGVSIIFASGDSGSGYQAGPAPPVPQCDSKSGTHNLAFVGTTFKTVKVTNKLGGFGCCTIARDIIAKTYAGWTFTPGPGGVNGTGVCTIFRSINQNETKAGSVSGLSVTPSGGGSPLWPSWPASSPWVTSVGATRFHGDVVGAPEDAVSTEDGFGSGSGFSFSFPTGTWQASAVATYLSTVDNSTLPPQADASWPPGGRATPDVSALGTGYNIYNGGAPLPGGVGGTSAATPVFSAIISLINEARIQAGKKQLGFLNNFIYQNPQAFADVTVGSDKIQRGGSPVPYGFDCAKGWDPVTGLGTPIFPALLKAAMALP